MLGVIVILAVMLKMSLQVVSHSIQYNSLNPLSTVSLRLKNAMRCMETFVVLDLFFLASLFDSSIK